MPTTKYGIRSLRFKLALTSTLVEIIMLALLIANSATIATEALENQTHYHVEEIVPLLNASLAIPLVERDFATLDDIMRQVVREGGIVYLGVTDQDEHLVAERGRKLPGYGQNKGMQETGGIHAYQHLDSPITLAGTVVGELHMSIDTHFLQLAISQLQREGMLIAGGEVIITFVLLVLVGVLLTRHLAILANAARTMSDGDLSVRVNVNTQDEIGAMAGAFNAMASRLEASYSSLKRSEQRYHTLTEVSPVGIFNTDAKGQCIYVNEHYVEITGLPQEKLLGTGWEETLHPDDRDEVVTAWECCAREEIPYSGEHRIVNAKGNVLWVYVQAVKTENAGGGYVGTITDITRLKAVEQELARHRDSLEELVRERTVELEDTQERLLRQERLATLGQLTATVSHELRNPLGVISNAVYYLKRKCPDTDGVLDEKIAQYLEMIQREVAAANRIISDLLATSRTKKPVVTWVNLDELLESIVASHVLPEHINWLYIRDPVPFMLRADPAQLTQVLRNLIGNAVQAISVGKSESGSICLSAWEDAGQYHLRISDSGPGVPANMQEQIFEPLFTTKAKGNGLGLWISRELIRGHGGELRYVTDDTGTVDDNENWGAAFLLVLPRGVAESRNSTSA